MHNQYENHNSGIEDQVRRDISLEIFRAAKIPEIQWMRKVVGSIVRGPVDHFSGLIAEFDASVRDHGYVSASNQILEKLAGEVAAEGEEFIPETGPLIIASNHPGTYDGLAIISKLPRNDFRLIVSGIPFFQNLPNASKNLIFATHDTADRMDVLRKSVRHLQGGGSLLIFPGGRLDPDPSIYLNADEGLKMWSRSIEVFLNKVPETQLVLTIASGVLSAKYTHHPIAKLFRNDHEQRRFMEFMQVIRQMALGKPEELHPKVTFAKPFKINEVMTLSGSSTGQTILERSQILLEHHIDLFYSDRKPNFVSS